MELTQATITLIYILQHYMFGIKIQWIFDIIMNQKRIRRHSHIIDAVTYTF